MMLMIFFERIYRLKPFKYYSSEGYYNEKQADLYWLYMQRQVCGEDWVFQQVDQFAVLFWREVGENVIALKKNEY